MALPAVYVRKDGITDIESESLDGLDEAGKNELKAKFIELRAKGWSYRKLARRLKVSKSTLSNWSIELEEEIASLKAMELEALAEQFYLLKEGRIRLLGGILKRIQKEVLSRDLSGVPTDRLLELLLRNQEALQEEYVEPKPLSGQEMEASGTILAQTWTARPSQMSSAVSSGDTREASWTYKRPAGS